MNKSSANAVEVIIAEPSEKVPAEAKLELWAVAALTASATEEEAIACALRVVSSAEMTELNTRFANKPKPTNVLSFPHVPEDDLSEWPDELADMIALDGGEHVSASIGDIAICSDVVAREAKEQGKSLDAHWAHMLVHGVLHLRGFDHTDDALAAIMESEEIRIMASLGFSNPYTIADDGAHSTS